MLHKDRKEEKIMKEKNERGITLIALVITIIVLLILAGAAVSIALDSGSVFDRANQAKTEWNEKVADEDEKLTNLISKLDELDGGSSPTKAGPQSDGSFIGLKSVGKFDEGEIDNYWQGATPVTVEGKEGYRFSAGHCVYIENYSGFMWAENANDFIEKTANVYLCWNDNYGEIKSEQDLINYAINNGTDTYWDIFDASSGAWLYKLPNLL